MVNCLTSANTILSIYMSQINVREYRRGNQKWTIQGNWQNRVHKTNKNKTKIQYVLNTTAFKQTQLT